MREFNERPDEVKAACRANLGWWSYISGAEYSPCDVVSIEDILEAYKEDKISSGGASSESARKH